MKDSYRKPSHLTALALFVSLPEVAFSQELSNNTPNAEVEEVVVTGSRILRNPLSEPAPVMDISEADLEQTGLTNIGAILQQLPMAGSAINAKFNVPGNSGFPQDGSGIGAGAAQISLRNVGAKRTLVLVDGKRWVAGASASGVPNAVDLNTIPANVIKKIEILQDGASAVYGSDAIGGVVNIITNSDYEGFRVSSQTGEFLSEGDGESSQYNLLWGGKSDNTHFVFSASYAEEKGVETSSRAQSAFPSPFGTSCEDGGCSSFTPQARIVLGPNLHNKADITLNDGVVNNGTSLPTFDPNNPNNDDYHTFTSADRFNFNGAGFNYLQTPNERVNLFTQVTHDFSDTLTLTTKASYTNRQSRTQGAPEPLCFGNGCGNAILDNITISANNPYNPFGVDLSVADGTLDFIGRRPLESGPRIFEQDVNTYFVSSSLQGQLEVSDRSFFWDITASYGDNRGFQQKYGAHNAARIANALGDPDVCSQISGCVPLNIFGGQGANGEGSITPEMLDYIGYVQRDFSEQTLMNYSANITGELFELPAGALAFASGIEYRDHDGRFQPDPIAERGETAGIAAGATAGNFDVSEAYTELNIPLLSEQPGANYLEVNLAVRTSDYSNFGRESTYKVGGLWQPIEDLSLRASQSTGIRAPGIGELFGGAAREDFTFLDPCADVLGTQGESNGGRDSAQSQAIINNCAALGISTDYAQTNPQLSAVSSGNDTLQAETSESVTFGMVYSPSWVDNMGWVESLTASIDFYDLEIDDAIQGRSPAEIITACVDTLDSFYCDAVERTSSGGINLVQNQLQNIGSINASGYDLALSYTAPAIDWGQMSLRLNATHLSEYTEKTENPDGSFSANELAGTITDETFQRAFPEWRYTTNVNWERDNWRAGLTFRYVDTMEQASGEELESAFYTDVQLQYRPSLFNDKGVTFTVGANNLFDEEPPVCGSCGSTNMSAVAHDLPGTLGYLRMSIEL